MAKFIIQWNTGYGDFHEVVEADNKDHALEMAYDAWRADAENNADYDAVPYSKEKAEDLGVE